MCSACVCYIHVYGYSCASLPLLYLGIIAHTLFDPEAGQVGRKNTEVPSPEVSFDLNAFTHYSAGCSRINAKFILGGLLFNLFH